MPISTNLLWSIVLLIACCSKGMSNNIPASHVVVLTTDKATSTAAISTTVTPTTSRRLNSGFVRYAPIPYTNDEGRRRTKGFCDIRQFGANGGHVDDGTLHLTDGWAVMNRDDCLHGSSGTLTYEGTMNEDWQLPKQNLVNALSATDYPPGCITIGNPPALFFNPFYGGSGRLTNTYSCAVGRPCLCWVGNQCTNIDATAANPSECMCAERKAWTTGSRVSPSEYVYDERVNKICSEFSGRYCNITKIECTKRPPTICPHISGVEPNLIDCQCGSIDSTATTGRYCLSLKHRDRCSIGPSSYNVRGTWKILVADETCEDGINNRWLITNQQDCELAELELMNATDLVIMDDVTNIPRGCFVSGTKNRFVLNTKESTTTCDDANNVNCICWIGTACTNKNGILPNSGTDCMCGSNICTLNVDGMYCLESQNACATEQFGACLINNGSAPNDKDCACGFAGTTCTESSGRYCWNDISHCSKTITEFIRLGTGRCNDHTSSGLVSRRMQIRSENACEQGNYVSGNFGTTVDYNEYLKFNKGEYDNMPTGCISIGPAYLQNPIPQIPGGYTLDLYLNGVETAKSCGPGDIQALARVCICWIGNDCPNKNGIKENPQSCNCNGNICTVGNKWSDGRYCHLDTSDCRDYEVCNQTTLESSNENPCYCGTSLCTPATGYYCKDPLNDVCSAGDPCLNTDGSSPNKKDCSCGSGVCNPANGMYCVSETSTCSRTTTLLCNITDASSPNVAPECLCGTKTVHTICEKSKTGAYCIASEAINFCGKQCDLGKYRNLDNGACVGCSAGRWSNSTDIRSDDECKGRCGPGKWSMTMGLTSNALCDSCSEGKWSNAIGLTSNNDCKLCSRGRYSETAGLTSNEECDKCPTGWFQNFTAKNYCLPCVPGEHQDEEGKESCKKCSAPNYFSDQVAQTNCKTKEDFICTDAKKIPNEELTACEKPQWTLPSECGTDQYLDNRNGKDSGFCAICPSGGYCASEDIEYNKLGPKFGYWPIPLKEQFFIRNNTSPFAECFYPPACLGFPNEKYSKQFYSNNTREIDLSTVMPPANFKSRNVSMTCNTELGFLNQSRLCSRCNASSRRDGAHKCKLCPNNEQNYALMVLGIFCVLGVFIFIAGTSIASAGKQDLSESVQKILINYLQVAALARQFPLRWPEELNVLFEFQGAISTLGDHLVNPDCIVQSTDEAALMYVKQAFFASMPFIIALFSFFFWYIYGLVIKSSPFFQKRIKDDDTTSKDKWVVTVGSLLYLIYPTLISNAFKLFDCTDIGGRSYLQSDLEERCYVGRHMLMVFILGLPQLIIFVLGLPLLLFWFLLKNHDELHTKHAVLARYGLFYDAYRKDKYYWELIIVIRKITIVLLSLLGAVVGVRRQAQLTLLVLLICIILEITAKPYKETTPRHRILPMLEFSSLCVQWLTMWSGLMIFTSLDEGSTLLVEFLTVSVVVLNAIMLICLLFNLMRECASEKLDDEIVENMGKMLRSVATMGKNINFSRSREMNLDVVAGDGTGTGTETKEDENDNEIEMTWALDNPALDVEEAVKTRGFMAAAPPSPTKQGEGKGKQKGKGIGKVQDLYSNPMKKKKKDTSNITIHIDEASGKKYSFNETTKETKWLVM